jgi:hypothetical protein
LRYVFQRIGFQCFAETRFDEAGRYLFEGDLDSRVLVSYYPELFGSLFSAEEVTDVFIGVAEHMPSESSVDGISKCHSIHFPHSANAIPSSAYDFCHPP